MKADAQVPRFAMGVLSLTILLIGCSKNSSSSTEQASASPPASTPAASESPAPLGNDQSVAPYTQATPPPPASSEVHPFSAAALIAAYAALAGSAPTQADAVSFALMSTQTDLACDGVRQDFTDAFAAHRNADRYISNLKSNAKTMGMSSADLPVSLGEYNFNEKAFPISVGYGAGTTTFVFNSTNKCYAPL